MLKLLNNLHKFILILIMKYDKKKILQISIKQDMKLKERELDFYKFKIKQKDRRIICGINNTYCYNCCLKNEEYNKYGCMYMKDFLDY